MLKNNAGYMIWPANYESLATQRRGNNSDQNKTREGQWEDTVKGMQQSGTYIIPQVDQHTITALHMMGLQPGNQSSHQQPELTRIERTRGVFGIDEQWA